MHFERGKQGINIMCWKQYAQRYLRLYICINVSTLFAVASLSGRIALSPFIVRTIEALPSHGHIAFFFKLNKVHSQWPVLPCTLQHLSCRTKEISYHQTGGGDKISAFPQFPRKARFCPTLSTGLTCCSFQEGWRGSWSKGRVMKNGFSPHPQAGFSPTAKPQHLCCQEFSSHSSLSVVATRPHGLLQSICILLGLFIDQGTKEQDTSSHWALISHFKWAILTFMVEQLPGRRGESRHARLWRQDRAASDGTVLAPLPAIQMNGNQLRAPLFLPLPPHRYPEQSPWWVQLKCFLDSPPTSSRCCWVNSLYHVRSESIE